MTCYIFLKSLRSLEEFRKNPHVKIPPKSPINFQSLGKFKNPIFNSEIIFFLFSAQPTPRPSWPLAQPAHRPHRPPQAESTRTAHPARASVTSSRKIRFPFRFTPSRAGRLSLISLSTRPHLSDSPPSPRRLTPVRNSPRRCPTPRMPRAFTTLPHHSPPLIPFKLSLNEP
jgi:hypothetical protein